MKYKIIEMKNNTFKVQKKEGFFSNWRDYISEFKSVEEAEKSILRELEWEKRFDIKRIVKIIDTKDL